jgi:hypothetical protein
MRCAAWTIMSRSRRTAALALRVRRLPLIAADRIPGADRCQQR